MSGIVFHQNASCENMVACVFRKILFDYVVVFLRANSPNRKSNEKCLQKEDFATFPISK